MKRKDIILTIAVLSTVTGLIYAEQWTNPTQKPPYGNTEPPINVSSKPQVKKGGISIGSLFTKGSAIFGNKVGIGTNTPSSPLEIAGKTEADQYCDRTGTKCIKISDLLTEIDGLKNKVASNVTNINNNTTNINNINKKISITKNNSVTNSIGGQCGYIELEIKNLSRNIFAPKVKSIEKRGVKCNGTAIAHSYSSHSREGSSRYSHCTIVTITYHSLNIKCPKNYTPISLGEKQYTCMKSQGDSGAKTFKWQTSSSRYRNSGGCR